MGWALRLEHDGYIGTALYSEPDKCYHGQIHSTTDLVMFEGKDYETLKEEFVIAVEDYKSTLKQLGL